MNVVEQVAAKLAGFEANWDWIHEKYKFAAQDQNGEWHVYASRPELSRRHPDMWNNGKDNAWLFTEHIKGGDPANWKQSLIRRPEQQK